MQFSSMSFCEDFNRLSDGFYLGAKRHGNGFCEVMFSDYTAI